MSMVFLWQIINKGQGEFTACLVGMGLLLSSLSYWKQLYGIMHESPLCEASVDDIIEG